MDQGPSRSYKCSSENAARIEVESVGGQDP